MPCSLVLRNRGPELDCVAPIQVILETERNQKDYHSIEFGGSITPSYNVLQNTFMRHPSDFAAAQNCS